MEHRGTARKRIVGVEGEGPLPPSGTEITAGGIADRHARLGQPAARVLRCFVSTAPRRRRPRASPLRAGEVTVALRIPAWARFTVPRRRPPHDQGASRRAVPWPGTDPLYVAYHDEEWGVPKRTIRALCSRSSCSKDFRRGSPGSPSCASARPSARAFDNFDAEAMARYGQRKVASLLRTKASSAIAARSRPPSPTRAAFLESGVGAGLQPIPMELRRRQAEAERLQANGRHAGRDAGESRARQGAKERTASASAARRRSMPSCRAIGMVNDHLTTCFRHAECAKLGKGSAPRRADPCCADRCALLGSCRRAS